MTPGGWVVLVISVGSVTSLFIWCLWLVFTAPEEPERLHGFDAQTPDKKK